MMRLAITLLLVVLPNAMALAQSHTPGGMPPPTGMSLAQSTAMRFPQPMPAGKLLHRIVLRPVESQIVLGRVVGVVRDAAGTVDLVMSYGGLLGFGSRPIAVPLDAAVLLGSVLEIVAYTPQQLDRLPTFTGAGETPVPRDTIVRVGLAKPSH